MFWDDMFLVLNISSITTNASMAETSLYFLFLLFSVFTGKLLKDNKFDRSFLLSLVDFSFALFKSSFLVFLKFIKNLRS
uniref:Uncharacterized protein n=1 Tax=Oxytricha trifallax TaxID=1172189 RepID=G9HRB2_9SPIT|nr:hypothetical protein [Oxytricha trifallax]